VRTKVQREGFAINVLFLCSQNKRRSLTAEKIFEKHNKYSVRSAGTESNSRVKVTRGMLGWAEVIFCMEKKHVRRLQEKYKDIIGGKEIICLNIGDDYAFMDMELVAILECCLDKYQYE